MRLDLFLKSSRLILRRSQAQEFCDAGLVTLNGSPAKSSKEVKIGDVIGIKKRNLVTKIRVARMPGTKQVSKTSASELYQVLEETRLDDDPVI